MKPIIISFLCILSSVAFGQASDDTSFLKQHAKAYLTKMYIERQYDSASTMWDKRMYLEMEDFYRKRDQGNLADSALYKRINDDVKKYYARLTEFSIDKFLQATVETAGGYKIGYVFYQFTHTVGKKRTADKTMLVFISEDEGKTWFVYDGKVKWIADQVDKNLL